MQVTEVDSYLALAALEALPEAIIITDTEYVIKFINPAACRLFGVTSDSVMETSLADLSSGSNKNHILKFHSTPIWDSEHSQSLGAVIKVEEVTAEHTARDLLSMMFNDMATPVNFIKSCADLLLEDLRDSLSGEQRKWLEQISDKAGRLWTLRKDVMETARRQFQGESEHEP